MYKAVIFGSDWDVYQYAFRDFIDNEKVLYIPTFRPHGIKGIIQRLHFNPRINRIVNIPCKTYWNSYFTQSINRTDNICFVILENWLRLESAIKLLPYLRKNFPNSKTVCFLQDLVTRVVDQYTNKSVDISYLKKYTDLCITYDNNNSKLYGMECFHTVYSRIKNNQFDKSEFDLYFLGRDKGRLEVLIGLSKEAERRGVKCHFNILDVPIKKRIIANGVHYLDNPLPYSENIHKISKSRCILELLQPNAKSATFRTWESIALNKCLMTCNTQIRELQIYDKEYVSIFSDADDFDWDFVLAARNKTLNLDAFANLISPNRLLDFIANILDIKIDY